MDAETVVGIKVGPLLAGMLGAVLSMRAIADATLVHRVTSMIAAGGGSAYVTPALQELWHLTAHQGNALAFFVGLVLLNVTAGVLEVSRKFASNPLGAVRELMDLLVAWRNVRGSESGARDGKSDER